MLRQVGNANAACLIHAPQDIPALLFPVVWRIVIGSYESHDQRLANKFDERRHRQQIRFMETDEDKYRLVGKVEVFGGEV